MENTEVRPGQVWADNDKRSTGRHVRVVEVDRTHATVELVSQRGRPWSGLRPGEPARAEPGRRTRIRLDRFKPTTTGSSTTRRAEPMRYSSTNPGPTQPRPLVVGERIKLDTDRRWWTIKAVTDNFAALTRQAEFHPRGTLCYTVLDWRNGVRGPCNLLGQNWGDGSYSEEQCAEMLAEFEAGQLEVSQRNWVLIRFGEG